MKQFNSADFSNSLVTLYVSRFEQECPPGSRMSARLRQVLTAYQRCVSRPGLYGGSYDLAEAKQASVLAGSLLEDLRAAFPEALSARALGMGGASPVQSLASLLAEISGELDRSGDSAMTRLRA